MRTRQLTEYVQEHNGRYVVAVRREDGSYQAPMRSDVQESTGAHSIFGSLSYVAGNAYSYARRGDALRRARQLFTED